MGDGPITRRAGLSLAGRLASLASVVVFLPGPAHVAAQPNPPTRLFVELSARTAHVGDSIPVTVALRDAYNAPTPAPKPYAVALEVLAKKTDPALHRAVVRIEKHRDSVVASVELTQLGVLLIRASHPELREGAAFISVTRRESHQTRDPQGPWRAPSSVARVALWHESRLAQPAEPAEPAPPASASRPALSIRYGHEGTKLTANGRDADTIDAFLSEPVAQPIRIHLWASSGWLRPNPILMPAGEVVAAARGELRTTQPGRTTIRVETITPAGAVALVEGHEAVAHFGVPIKALRLWCSPSEVSLGSETQVRVQLLGLENEAVSPDEAKDIEISVDRQGVLEPNPVTLGVGELAATARFLPQWTGPFLLTASTFGATTAAPSRLDAVWPWPTTAMLVVGGLVGGAMRARKARRWTLRFLEALAGPLVAVVAYLAVLYGLIPRLGPFVGHPFFAAFLAILAGHAGAVLLDRLAKVVFGSLDMTPPAAADGR